MLIGEALRTVCVLEELARCSAMLTKFEYFQLPCSTYSYEKMVDTEIMYKLMIQIYVSFQVFTAGVAGLFCVLNAGKDKFVPTSRRNVGTDFTALMYRPRRLSFEVNTSSLSANSCEICQ